MRRIPAVLVAPTLLALLLAGCADGPRACTLIGGFEGVTVQFPDSVALRQGFVAVEVCDAEGCADTRQSIGRIRPGTPPARQFEIGFGSGLDRSFEPGPVTVTAAVLDADGTALARGSGEVELTPTYPNGRECDGDGFTSGTLVLDEDDLVEAP